MKLSELKQWDRNPRQISEDERVGLKESLSRFGDLSGITFNTRNESLVSGHERVERAKELCGGQDPEIVELSQDRGVFLIGNEQFVVRFVDWDEETHAAANLAANSTFLAGKYTDDAVGLIESLGDADMINNLRLDDLADSLLGERGFKFGFNDQEPEAKKSKAADQIESMELQPFEHYDYVLVLARRTHEWNRLCELLDLQDVRKPRTSQVGVGRAIDATKLLELIDAQHSDRGSESQANRKHGKDSKPAPKRTNSRRRKRAE